MIPEEIKAIRLLAAIASPYAPPAKDTPDAD